MSWSPCQRYLPLAALSAMAPAAVWAQPAAGDVPVMRIAASDTGDTAWVLAASVLVLLAALPGLGLFYGGRVRAKNFLSVLAQVGAVAAIASVLWVVVGYTLAFGDVTNGWIGNGRAWMLNGLGSVRSGTTLPESGFALFQMAFAVVAPALTIGAIVERVRFGWLVSFCALWSVLVYAPVVHWIWGGGWLAQIGVLDFAGGLAVHTVAGVSALVVALLLGKRTGFPGSSMRAHAPGLAATGGALLWIGWLGLVGGSALTATDDAASAMINAHVCAATAALAWLLVERIASGRPTRDGWSTGAVAGLAAITPAAGFVSPGAAIVFGILAALTSYGAIRLVKVRLRIDDSLDVFAVHGAGGILGLLLLAVFLSDELGGLGYGETLGMGGQMAVQALGIGAVVLFGTVATAILALMVSVVFPMGIIEEVEREGRDSTNRAGRARDLD